MTKTLPLIAGTESGLMSEAAGDRTSATGADHYGVVPPFAKLERLSIELTRACTKGCAFCYNGSHPKGATSWTVPEIVALAEDCLLHGLRSLSFGGGEPLQFPGLTELLEVLDGRCFRSLTTNGLLLDRRMEELVAARPDKVHLSIHFPEDSEEVERVARQVVALAGRGIRSGVNLLVRRSLLTEARHAAEILRARGIEMDRVLFLPMRGQDTPTPKEIANVAGNPRFQSVTCLGRCAASPRFASVGWDRRVAWCSYTTSRRPLQEISYRGLVSCLQGLPLATCSTDPEP